MSVKDIIFSNVTNLNSSGYSKVEEFLNSSKRFLTLNCSLSLIVVKLESKFSEPLICEQRGRLDAFR